MKTAREHVRGALNNLGDKKIQRKKEQLNYKQFKEAQILNEMREITDESYQNILDEIAYYQYQMYKADKKAINKQKRHAQERKTAMMLTSREQLQVRKEIIQEAGKENGLFDHIIEYLKQVTPVVRYIGQICAKFICMILKFDMIKKWISRPMLEKIDLVYQICVNL